ncbi:MAG: Ig-like domain-containing protein, partial [Candidatus Riflebacteria bacterium]|nr:Ig-like domain-containing protein [Candidatus Riflebacteria bacterium]
SGNQQGANIDFTTNKNDLTDKAVTGSYEHSFEVSNIKVENTIGNTAELSFELNLDGVSLDDFPKDFLVEFYSKGSDENTRPFEYTQTFGFETKNQGNPDNPDPDNPTVTDYKITYDLKGGTLTEENPNGYNTASETFKLNEPTKVGYEFIGWTGSNGDTPQILVSVVQGSKSDLNYVANYSIVNYALTYTNVENCTFATANPTTYNVETETFTLTNPTKDDYIFLGWTYEGQTTPQLEVNITKGSTTGDKTYTANWEAMIIASLKSATTNFAVDGQIQIEFDKEITWQDSYKSKITVTPTSTTTPITINTYSYSNKVLTLTPANNLKYNTGYTVAIAGIEKVSDKNLTFTTVDLAVTPVITSDSTNSPAELNGKFMLQPTFTIDFGKAVINQNSATSSVKLNGSALPDSAAFAFDSDGKIATLTFSSNLLVNKDYQLSITSFVDDDNSTIKAVSGISFNTIETDRFGEGTESSPFLIFTASDLKGCGGNYYFKQMKDIVLPNEDWTPLGGASVKYDGNHHKIIGLKIINNDNANYVGLFSHLDNSAIVQNLTIENVDIKGNMHIGGLAGQATICRIENVHISGNISIKGIHQVGGLIGVIGQIGNVTITKSSVSSEDGIIEGSHLIGGLVGNFQYNSSAPHDLNNIISESYVKIKLKCERAVGGLVGDMEDCEVKNCYSDSTITIVEGSSLGIGGLIGGMDDDSKVTNSYSRGTIVVQSQYASSIGGLIGSLMDYVGSNGNFGEVKNNFTSMSISGANFGNCPLYSDYGYVYEDTTYHNYLSDGYPATGANWDGWDASVWSGLSAGSYPTLVNNPPASQP